jgi:hypothetical protein
MIRFAVTSGLALASIQASSSIAKAQCPSCGSNHAVAGAPVVQSPALQGQIAGVPNAGAPIAGVPGVGVPGVGIPGLSTMHQMTAQAAASHPGNTVAYGNILGRGTQPLFENYFTQGNANQATAGMYMSPIGVPGNVGHTYYTYQPFYPHQYLYQHHDRYHSYYDGGRGLNRTHASYTAPPARSAVHWLHKSIQLPHR